MNDFGCFYCWDSRKKQDKSPFLFFDAANNLRKCEYCPKCGRKYGEVPINEQLESTTSLEQYDDGASTI